VTATRRCKALAGVASAGLIACSPATALAHDHVPPATGARIAGEKQHGSLYSSSWTEPLGGYCVTAAGDGPYPRKSALNLDRRRATAKIELRKAQRPDELVVSGWRRVDENGSPAGPGEQLRARLQRRGHGDERHWIARVKVDLATPLYLDVFGRWRDRQGCETWQDASWAFHLAHRQ